jgi:hypothetical protein
MSRSGHFLSIIALSLAACVSLACGNSQHQIQSLTLSPSSADAQNYPNGQVPFIATGTYNTPPLTVAPLQANWGAETEQNGFFTGSTTAVSVNSSGLAQCTVGASGTYAIGAWVLIDPHARYSCASMGAFGQPGCNSVLGTAQITCP